MSSNSELDAQNIDKKLGTSFNGRKSSSEDFRSVKFDQVEWLTSKQASEYLQISEGTLRNMTSNGRIPYSKLGRSNRYSVIELRQLLLSNRRGV